MDSTTIHSPSKKLQEYFNRLQIGSAEPSEDEFINGMRYFAAVTGPARAEYFGQTEGLDYPSHVQLDNDERYLCPPSWSAVTGSVWVLTYKGDGPPSKALNELFLYPTAICCGMNIQLCLLMSTRYCFGDNSFDQWVVTKDRPLVVTEGWRSPLDDSRTSGNVLFEFYDTLFRPQARIQTRLAWNHPTYSYRHPGGRARLENIFVIDKKDILVFDPRGGPNILSRGDVDERLLQEYNLPQDIKDRQMLDVYHANPTGWSPSYLKAPFWWLARKAIEYEDCTLSKDEWEASRYDREKEEDVTALSFNFEKLSRSILNEGSKQG